MLGEETTARRGSVVRPRTMRAWRVEAPGASPVQVRIARPATRRDHTLVRLGAAAVNHFDRGVAQGLLSPSVLPSVGGTEGVGEVVTTDLEGTGTRVLVRGEGIGTRLPGCWAEFVSAPDAAVTELPAGIDDATGCALVDVAATALTALHDVGRVSSGDAVMVGGAAGAVGRAVTSLAVAAGARRVIAEVSTADRAVGLPPQVEVVTAAEVADRSARGTREIDLLVDTVGGGRLEAALGVVVPGGRAALLGYAFGPRLTLDLPRWLLADIALLPVNMIRRSPGRDRLGEVMDMVGVGGVSVETQTFEFDQLSTAFAALLAGGLRGRAVVRMDHRSGITNEEIENVAVQC